MFVYVCVCLCVVCVCLMDCDVVVVVALSQNMGSTTALPTHTQVEVVRFESVSEGVSSYIAYVIHVRCRHEEWTVTRRYTDFFEFSKQVNKAYSFIYIIVLMMTVN